MNQPSYSQIGLQGLWHNNPGLVQLLGLCPLLAVSATVTNALALGFATTLTLAGSNAIVSASRRWLRPEIRIPAYVLVIASLVTAIELVMNAWFHELYNVLGIFIPLIVTNCVIIGRAEAFASRQPLGPAIADGLAMGLGFTATLVVLGALRELLGSGTLLANADWLFGAAARDWTVTVWREYRGFLLALLPPGAFLGLGLLVAVKNGIDQARGARAAAPAAAPAPASA